MSYSMVRTQRRALGIIPGYPEGYNPLVTGDNVYDWVCSYLVPGGFCGWVKREGGSAFPPSSGTGPHPTVVCPDGYREENRGTDSDPLIICVEDGYGTRHPDEEVDGGSSGSGGGSSGGGYNTVTGSTTDGNKTPTGRQPVPVAKTSMSSVPVVAVGSVLGLVALMLLL